MVHDDLELERILTRRAVPMARADLAERIIHAAVATVQGRMTPLSFWQELMGMIAIPHPSMVAAAIVLLGLVAGLQAGDLDMMQQTDWSSFLYINDGGAL